MTEEQHKNRLLIIKNVCLGAFFINLFIIFNLVAENAASSPLESLLYIGTCIAYSCVSYAAVPLTVFLIVKSALKRNRPDSGTLNLAAVMTIYALSYSVFLLYFLIGRRDGLSDFYLLMIAPWGVNIGILIAFSLFLLCRHLCKSR